MADFDLTQTDAQVQSILNNAQDAQGAGAQTTLTNDYIMLKGTNGRYHKIQKESFTEAVRNTLASLLVNNDKGTTISQIAAIASGDFGSITPANLASVLGAVRLSGLTSNGQDNTNLLNGIYQVVGDSSNSTQTDWGLLFNINYNERLGMQLKFCVNRKTLNFRARDAQDPAIWTEWKEL